MFEYFSKAIKIANKYMENTLHNQTSEKRNENHTEITSL